MGSATGYVTNEYEVGLPPLRMERKAIWDYYRIEFLPNGYPGRRTDGVLMAHPIYGPYVITDYLIQYGLTDDPAFLKAAIQVADVSVAMMEPLHDGLVFNYDEERSKVSSKKGTWYSGLTQSRYVDVLSKLQAYPGTERFREPLKAVLNSLTIPVQDGGVARYTADGGLIIEEYPATFPNCTLNGWTTATCILLDVAKSTNDDRDWAVFNKSVRGMESIISLYDVPELANSRYKLEGDATFQLTATGSDVQVTDCQVVVPSAGIFAANIEGDQAGEALKAGPLNIRDGKLGRVKVHLSRFSWPAPNRLLLKVSAERATQVKVAIGETTYNPFGSVPKVTGQKHLQEFALAPGENLVEVPVPWIAAEMIAHPTNFSKKLTGRQFNVYHYYVVDAESNSVGVIDGNAEQPVRSDFNGDRKADVLARDTAGVLWLYPGNGSGGWLPRVQVGQGWNVMNALVAPGDFDGDGSADVLARDGGGALWLYPGNGSGNWLPRVQVGSGWEGMTAIEAIDFHGDGFADVVARARDGALWVYRGDGKGGWLPRMWAGSGWSGMSEITGVADFNGDGISDLVARDGAGTLFLYPPNGYGSWLQKQTVGQGWNSMNSLVGPGDFNGDGRADILARNAAGELWLYAGHGGAAWSTASKVGSGWNGMNAIL